MRRKHHRNPSGNWCRCPWGSNNNDPYTPESDLEIWGSTKESMWHEASKLEWLRGRPDMQGEDAQQFLNYLELHAPKHDTLYPWLAREWKNQRLTHQSYYPEGNYQDSLPFTYKNHDGQMEGLEGEDLDMLNRWMKYKKQAKQGVDIMKHEIGHVIPEASKWDAGGEQVWNSDEDPDYYGDPYQITHLRNRRDLRVEGRRMQHCIGSNGMGYDSKLQNGQGLYYSIRDHRNNPVGTLEFEPTQNQYYQCPSCHKFVAGGHKYDPETRSTTITCENCGHTLVDGEGDLVEGAKSFPVDLSKMAKNPDARFMEPKQFYGFKDGRIPDEAVEATNHYFNKFGHDTIAPDSHDDPDEEEEAEPQSLADLGYEDAYDSEDPSTFDDLQRWYEEPDSLAPQDYHNAVRDAQEHGLDYPELYPGSPDWEGIFNDITGDKKVNPENYQQLWNIAYEHGAHHDLNDLAKTWLEDEYHNYLDPYGKSDGNGFLPPHDREITAPINPETGNKYQYPHLPSSHYPGPRYGHEEYIARNLQHQLDKHDPIDPQTGMQLRENDYPIHTPNTNSDTPFIKEKGPTPIPEQSGNSPITLPTVTDRGQGLTILPHGQENWRTDLTYPGEDHPTLDNTRWYPEPRRQRIPYESEPNSNPVGIGNIRPEQYFTPGREDIRYHQRAFPNMEFTYQSPDGSAQYQQPLRPWNPNVPEYFEQGEAQGHFMPKNWYIDYQNHHTRETNLPEHLFPPEHYGYHTPQIPGQQTMWDYNEPSPGQQSLKNQHGEPYANINTLAEEPKNIEYQAYDDPGMQDIVNEHNPAAMERVRRWRNRQIGDWTASVKESGPWTDYENEQIPSTWNTPHQGDVYNNGSIVQFNPTPGQLRPAEKEMDESGDNPWYFTMPGMDWRVPVLYHKPENRMYAGREGMEHGDLARQFGLPEPWSENLSPNKEIQPGYIDVGGHTVDGGLHFFGDYQPPNHPELEDWAEDQYGVRSKAPKFQPSESEIWSSTKDNFEVTIPEARWIHD